MPDVTLFSINLNATFALSYDRWDQSKEMIRKTRFLVKYVLAYLKFMKIREICYECRGGVNAKYSCCVCTTGHFDLANSKT